MSHETCHGVGQILRTITWLILICPVFFTCNNACCMVSGSLTKTYWVINLQTYDDVSPVDGQDGVCWIPLFDKSEGCLKS